MYRTEMWQPIHVELHEATVLTPNHKPLPQLYRMRYETEWKPYVPQGRGEGTYPKGPMHVFRDYRYPTKALGHKHIQIYANRPTNSCELCGGREFGGRDTKLDYFAFYRTGEIFTWMDPIFMNGHIHVDPRKHEQPEDSPLVIKWICEPCYTRRLEDANERIQEYETRWERYKFAFAHSPPRRYLIDRRVLPAPWQDVFAEEKLPDRRKSLRRNSDVPPLIADRFEARAALMRSQSSVTDCNT